MRIAGAVIAVLLVLSVPPSTGSVFAAELSRQESVGLLNDGLRAFDRGTALAKQSPGEAAAAFAEAAAKFQQIVDAGVENGRLYYNLGNAHLKSGRIGPAIANYLRAAAFMPQDTRLQENLAYARLLCQCDIRESGERAATRTVFFWHYGTPLSLRFRLGLATYVLFWLLLIGRTLIGRIRWGYPAAVCLVLWLALGVSVGVELRHSATHQDGVITTPDVVVRKGNGLDYAPQLKETLAEGVEFEVVEERGAWLHIQLADGKDGWVQRKEAEII